VKPIVESQFRNTFCPSSVFKLELKLIVKEVYLIIVPIFHFHFIRDKIIVLP
jgi:hypothetical protein